MNKFHELDQELAGGYNINSWSDDAILYASELADSLSDDEWSELERTWRERPVEWQVRLAEAAYPSEKSRVINLLMQMLRSPETEVALTGAEHLAAKDDVWTPDASVREDLENLLSRVEGKRRDTIESLIAVIPK